MSQKSWQILAIEWKLQTAKKTYSNDFTSAFESTYTKMLSDSNKLDQYGSHPKTT